MSFAKFSSDFLMETYTLVDNVFINEYLPCCDENQIRVYLYGLYLCVNPTNDNSVDSLCEKLDMQRGEVLEIYKFFEELGIVKIISETPLEVKYLSLKNSMQSPKRYKKEAWNDFNTQLQQLFPDRMIMPNEFNQYYIFLDETKLDKDAMLMIVQYCINLKGNNVKYPYILAVARNWVADGVRTSADVEKKLDDYEQQSEQMQQVLYALSRKGGADLEEKQMLLKWTRSWGYDLDAILTAIKIQKGSKSFKKTDQKLDEFYRMSIFSKEEILDYQAQRERLKETAIAVNKNLGVYYESFDHEIEVYIAPWIAKGFDQTALELIAHHCFVSNIRALDGMNNVVNKFYAQGLLTSQSIDEFLSAQMQQDAKIRKIIEKTGRSRGVTLTDREYYRTWTATWGFDDDVILYAAEQAVGKTYPTPFVNQLLSNYKSAGITTIEQAKLYKPQNKTAQYQPNFKEREYTPEELQSVITSIDSFNEEDL